MAEVSVHGRHKAVILSLLATVTPPVALVALAWDFIKTTHSVPGWVFPIGAGALGLLVSSIVLNVAQLVRSRRAARRTLRIVGEGYPSSLWWHMGAAGTSQPCRSWEISTSRMWPHSPSLSLERSCWFPTRRAG